MSQFCEHIVNDLSIGIAIFDVEGNVLQMNRQAQSIADTAGVVFTLNEFRRVFCLKEYRPPIMGTSNEEGVFGNKFFAIATRTMIIDDTPHLLMQISDITFSHILRETGLKQSTDLIKQIRARIAPVFNTMSICVDYPDGVSETETMELFRLSRIELWFLERQCANHIDLLRIGAGMPIEIPPLAELLLSAIIADALYAISPFVKDVEMVFYPRITVADSVRIMSSKVLAVRVVVTVLLNACMYSRANPDIQITARRCDNEICLSISDNGIGMDCEDLAFVCTRGFRGKASLECSYPGSGSELYLARNIMRSLGGRIEIDSAPETGTLVDLYFPAASVVDL